MIVHIILPIKLEVLHAFWYNNNKHSLWTFILPTLPKLLSSKTLTPLPTSPLPVFRTKTRTNPLWTRIYPPYILINQFQYSPPRVYLDNHNSYNDNHSMF
jgi:hypothetical protein